MMFGHNMLFGLSLLILLVERARAHIMISYPLWRGNNLISNGTDPWLVPGSIGGVGIQDTTNGTAELIFPYGMQYTYPCGGLPLTTNRSAWPVGGGAVAFQPGMGNGNFKSSFIYINIGKTEFGSLMPMNYSHSIVPPIALTGVNNSVYPDTVCIPQVGLPAGMTFSVGDNVTIQVVQVAATGEAVYSCSDVTLQPNGDKSIELLTPQNCYNSTDLSISSVFTTTALTSGALRAAVWLPSPTLMFSVAAFSAAYALL